MTTDCSKDSYGTNRVSVRERCKKIIECVAFEIMVNDFDGPGCTTKWTLGKESKKEVRTFSEYVDVNIDYMLSHLRDPSFRDKLRRYNELDSKRNTNKERDFSKHENLISRELFELESRLKSNLFHGNSKSDFKRNTDKELDDDEEEGELFNALSQPIFKMFPMFESRVHWDYGCIVINCIIDTFIDILNDASVQIASKHNGEYEHYFQ